jgi:MIP family channel proteins
MEASTAEGAHAVPPRSGRPTARATDSPTGGIAAYAAEFIGTLMLVFAVAMVVIVNSGGGLGVTDWAVLGLVHAFVLMLLIVSLGGASGAHFNPAVTIALAVGRKIRPADAVVYILVQIAGAIVGALIAKLLLDDEGAGNNVNYGTPSIAEADPAPAAQPGVPPAATGPGWLDGKPLGGMFAELIGTFFLMWAIMATAVNPRGDGRWAGLVIGGTLGAMVMILGPLTGAGLNPARTYGPGVVASEFPNALAYVAGPIVGAVLAYVLYTAIVLNPQGRDPGDRPIDHLE